MNIMGRFMIVVMASFIASSALATIKFNPDLVRHWNEKDKAQFPTPLIASFRKGDQTLVFVGDHHVEPTKTYHFTDEALKKYSPEIIVVESLEYSAGKNPKVWLDKYTSKQKEEVWKDPSLGSGTELLAISHGIPVIGGEPSIEEEMSSSFILRKGFEPEDIRNVKILQRIPYRRDQLKMTDLKVFFDYAMKLYKAKESSSDFRNSFFTWYKKRTQEDFDYNKITKSTAAVNCKADDTFLQRVACAINVNRDRALVEHIGLLFKTYKRVMVVYGTGHFVQEYPVYLKAFGNEPEYLQPKEEKFEK